jgi:hypothetical protein
LWRENIAIGALTASFDGAGRGGHFVIEFPAISI